ncbi:tRNA-specific adenosine deaminase 1-like [Mycena kentingensis (nom. inval.)]|nr:tRNA-specific adenosine deaminase 1-like [Mycena kentingensis (nom. inval.)]
MSAHNKVESIHKLYTTLRYKPPPRQFTVLAAFYVVSGTAEPCKIISLATGTKCLPANKLPAEGEAVHDSHAEVLARRGAVRWLLEEIARGHTDGAFDSAWLDRELVLGCDDARYTFALKAGVRLGFYVSTVPCGDASMGLLALTQDAAMAALKNASQETPSTPNLNGPALARGRDNYALLGVLRTKPARADAPPTASMSCSDKIAAWTYLGVQGALGARFFSLGGVYVAEIVIGLEEAESVRKTVEADCLRALSVRVAGVPSSDDYAVHTPEIHFTTIPFVHSSSMTPDVAGSCNESLYWVADSPAAKTEVLINGLKRGVSPNQRLNPRFLPRASRKSMLQLYHDTLRACGLPPERPDATLQELKFAMLQYRRAKETLMGPEGVFRGWVRGADVSFT